jgi:uncharacterized RDD family membrane protein YckC
MSTQPPEGAEPPGPPPGPPPVPPGYQPGDYIPYKDRDPSNPTAVAGAPAWTDQAQQQAAAYAAQQGGAVDPYRSLYGWDAPERIELAGWSRRVLGYLFDMFLYTVAAAPALVGYLMVVRDLTEYTDQWGTTAQGPGFEFSSTSIGLILVGGALAFAFYVYNFCIRQGRTGYSLGKTVVGIKLVGDATKQPIGAGMSFVRQLAHVVDSLVCNLGYLWPIWDARKQTFADKLMNTIVIVQPQDQPKDPAGYEATPVDEAR